jgi:PhnB protein
MSTPDSNRPQIETYLCFEGRCEEALKFYEKNLGAKINAIMRFKDNPEPPPADQPGCGSGDPNKVMHACLTIANTTIMASDGSCTGSGKFGGFSLTYSVSTEEEARRIFGALAEGGQVHMPLGETFFAKIFGVVADPFGVSWMVIIPKQM